MRNTPVISGLALAALSAAMLVAPASGQQAPQAKQSPLQAACNTAPGAPAGPAPVASVPRGTAANIAAALQNKARPAGDICQDSLRKPADMLAFAGVGPNTTVAEWIPGGGYFTRIFSKAVSAGGHLYVLAATTNANLQGIAADANYGGKVTIVAGTLTSIKPPVPVDVVWTSRNYHDLPVATRTALNKSSFDMLKPGGIYIVLDHSALVGSGDYAVAQRPSLHRIDENFVKLEVMQSGFKYVGESNVLRNADDNRTGGVMDSSIRGDTDQFVLKFQKPR